MYAKNDEAQVVIVVDDGLGYEWSFRITCASVGTAQIPAKHFKEELFRRDEKLKREFYRSGYADGKAKRANLWK